MDNGATLDLNADLGESYGVYHYGEDDALFELVASANIACGFHAGDPTTMRAAVEAALSHGVRIGAHPGLPDRLGFGRRFMKISPADAYSYTLYQVGALHGIVEVAGGSLSHVKPHGALYMMACGEQALAEGIVQAVADFDASLAIYALPDSALERAAVSLGLEVYPEFFADRPYRQTEVQMFDWTYEDIGGPDEAAARVAAMTRDPAFKPIRTVCVHSDTHGAADIARAVKKVLAEHDPSRDSVAV